MDCDLRGGHGDAAKQFRPRFAVAHAGLDRDIRSDFPVCEKERTHGKVRPGRLGEEQQSHAVVHSFVAPILYESLRRISA